MHPHPVALRPSALQLFLATLIVSCSNAPRTVDQRDSGGDSGSSCAYSRDFACWRCSGGVFGKKYHVGCRAKNDCKMFCGPLPAGYTVCDYSDPTVGGAGPLCIDWPQPPRGTLAGCGRSQTSIHGYPTYACPFCLSIANLVTYALDDQGHCLAFYNSCTPQVGVHGSNGRCRLSAGDAAASRADGGDAGGGDR